MLPGPEPVPTAARRDGSGAEDAVKRFEHAGRRR